MCWGGEKKWVLFTDFPTLWGVQPSLYPLLNIFLLYNRRKEMASLRENGQKYKCPFFKSAKEILQTPSQKSTLLA